VLEKFIARQPIFDQRLKVFAYELLFRAGTEDVFRPRKEASSSTIVDSVMLFDSDALTGCAKAFLNFDEPSLRRGAARLLSPDRVVKEIIETIMPTPDVIRLGKELSAAGRHPRLLPVRRHPRCRPSF
jgi:c-di-GMP-related signal transduction protein